jgi:iron(III) transport system substrate-binding protein
VPTSRHLLATTCLAGVLAAGVASAAEVNVYSGRHYDTDAQLYEDFTAATGIQVNLIEGNAEELVERIKAEGANSPADVLITVDAGRLYRADNEGLFQPVDSAVLNESIPDEFRHPDGHWFGYTTRMRVIYYDKERIDPDLAQTYDDLTRPELAGEVCLRSGSNIYNLSLLGSLIEHHGEAAAREWAEGIVANFARPPEGGDTDQIIGVGTGQCGVAVANHYYFVRLMTSDDPANQAVVERTGIIFPNQDDRGAHVNISGAGVLVNAPNRDNAVAFLEYLASPAAQTYFIAGNNEFPTVDGVEWSNPYLEELGAMDVKRDEVSVAVFGTHQPLAQIIMDEVGWK